MQKIVIQVPMPCQKCKSKAMKIAVMTEGVSKVEIQIGEMDKLVVIGKDVDSVNLTRSLRKGLRFATLESVQEEKDQKKEEKEEEEKPIPIQWSASMDYYPHWPMLHQIVACDPNPSVCSIM